MLLPGPDGSRSETREWHDWELVTAEALSTHAQDLQPPLYQELTMHRQRPEAGAVIEKFLPQQPGND